VAFNEPITYTATGRQYGNNCRILRKRMPYKLRRIKVEMPVSLLADKLQALILK
jgi:hypothetical protein